MSSRGRTSSNSGFTLIEVLAVLVLVAATVAVAVPRVAGMMQELATRRAVGDLVFLLRRARVEALERGRTVRVTAGEGTLIVEAEGAPEPVAVFSIPPVLSIPEAALAESIEFYALGNSSGWETTVVAGERTFRVRVDQLTGDVQSEPAGG